MKRTLSLFAAALFTLMTTAQNVSSNQKMSPYLGHVVQEKKEIAASRMMGAAGIGAQQERISVLTKLTNDANIEEVLARHAATLESRIGNVLIVSLPIVNVEAMAADSQVLRVEAERAPRPMLDEMPKIVGADKANGNTDKALPQAFTGKGVVVGIVDSGFDYTNPFFKTADGKQRIQWAADYMTNKTYGTPEEVTTALHSSDARTMFHGTHVAGIAAGSKVNDVNDNTYCGIAPEADIAMGAVNSEIVSDGTGLTATSSIKAMNDIFAYAEAQGKPCVINYSMGDAMSFANNRQLEEEAIATMLSKPGRALVVSSGNSGGTSRLAHKEATADKGGAGVMFNEDEQYGEYFGIELKVKDTQTITLQLTNNSYTTNKAQVTFRPNETATKLTFGTRQLTLVKRGTTTDGYSVIYVTAGLATFSTSDRILVTVSGEGDAWIYADALCAQLENVRGMEGFQNVMAGYSMTWPAQMNEVVTVGNTAHRFQIVTVANKYASQGGVVTPTDLTAYESTKGVGYLAKSSSVGPTLSGQMKPDVCAPGVNIVSAQNFFIDDDTYYALAGWDMAALDTEWATFGNDAGYYHIMAQTGTSMSAPAVTGTIALWMQADPTLTTERIKDIFANTSRQPDSELSYPNNEYGHGEVDAYKGLCYMLGINKIDGVSDHQPQKASFSLNNRRLTINFDAEETSNFTVNIYSVDGRKMLSSAGETEIDLSQLRAGVYAVQVKTGNRETTGSTLIRIK